jgi:hypothetical protein
MEKFFSLSLRVFFLSAVAALRARSLPVIPQRSARGTSERSGGTPGYSCFGLCLNCDFFDFGDLR